MKKNPHPLSIAFDVDDTIYKIYLYKDVNGKQRGRQVPDFKLMPVLLWFIENGDNVFIWSAGGISYVRQICEKFGIIDKVSIISKPPLHGSNLKMDLTFDDSEIGLGKVNVLVNRDTSEHNQFFKGR